MITRLLRHWLVPAPVVVRAPEVPEHAVHFYAREEALVSRLEEFVLEGARLGETVIVIATAAHREALRDRLEAFEMQDAFVGQDAADTLATFMRAGLPDPQLFDQTVGALVRTTVSHGAMRAYGEMVALLWAQDNVAGTYALEELWNALQQEVAFPLLCAYPLPRISDDLGPGLAQVCRLHTHVARVAA